ncbi:hypothetical protein F511_01988 [Dorcoceras hygrometricum]|uniref:Dof-type domain-containing protein n=1 Tax=Dorcoceras hygrometricum TaxID=472368 RepID=A0A2Z7AUH0_9LAMI|nr:hypothetical protein F511_01988 [Dorcoceras hygrometricum]
MQQEEQYGPLRCHRCDSTDTKFRYYNNNDRRQPRHYCKTCKRYWTVGGSMRDVPLGGTRRPAKDSSSQLYTRISVSSSRLRHPDPVAAAGSPKIEPIIPPADEISCLAAIRSLTKPDMAILQERCFRSMGLNLNEPLPQHLPTYGGNPTSWPMITPLPPQDFNDDLSFAAANAGIWYNSNGNTDEPGKAPTSVDLNYWPQSPKFTEQHFYK